MKEFRSIHLSALVLVALLALSACSYESGLSGLSCEEEGLQEGDRVCQDGYWVDEGAALDGGDSISDTVEDVPDISDTVEDARDVDEDADAGECVPTASEEVACDQMDDDCDGSVDEGLTTEYFFDSDGDGEGDSLQSTERCDPPPDTPDGTWVTNEDDCDDDNVDVNTDAIDGCISEGNCPNCNGRDDDCDGQVDEECPCDSDEEQDCFPFGGGASPDADLCDWGTQTCTDGTFDECRDYTGPSAEMCDGMDNDCDGTVDEGVKTTFYIDDDGDGHGVDSSTEQACSAPQDYVDNNDDCDDSDSSINPDASESCNQTDDDCDGNVDEGVKNTYYEDSDGDGFGDSGSTQQACSTPDGYADNDNDCNDSDDAISPDGSESCNGTDDDCDGNVDEGVTNTYYEDSDGDGFGDSGSTQQACSAPSGYVADSTDCDDSDGSINPDASESCNGDDDDCDGTVDEGVKTTFYVDDDGDGYGVDSSTQDACMAPSGYVDNDEDCDDEDPTSNPGEDEICDGLDNDCDGTIDERPDTDDWCASEANNSTVNCDTNDGYMGSSCCEDTADAGDVCEFETNCHNGGDDDENGDTDCEDTNCDGRYCDPGKICRNKKCEAI